jgi:Zn ribbon nucleic-acid-binding protein
MKFCKKCQKNKSESEFYSRADRKGRVQSYCKACFNAYSIQRWINKKLEAIEYLGGACCHCGYNDHYAPMQFHHTDPSTKDFTWDKLRLKSWSSIKAELSKCVLLCANCHSVVHSNFPTYQ